MSEASAWHREVPALPFDLYRIGAGTLLCAYFIRLLREFSTYTARDGLLDHDAILKIFWFSGTSLFGPWMPEWLMFVFLLVALVACLGLTLGFQPRACALVALVIGVSCSRWNFPVINVDDASMHLALFWLFLFPVGKTLTLHGPRRTLGEQLQEKAPGGILRLFFVNLFIYYLTAGLTKLASPLWREGLALYAILKLPLARTHAWWDLDHLWLLWIFNHLTLILEPLFPFIIFLPKGHPLKYLGGISWFVFHLSIPLTIGVPYANLGLILALFLVFYQEIADYVSRRSQTEPPHYEKQPGWAWNERVALVFVCVLSLAMTKGIPVLEKTYQPAMALLYVGGVAQEYHLFDWVDRFNFAIEYEVRLEDEAGNSTEIDPARLFPLTVRGFIVQSYFFPMRWMRLPKPLMGEFRRAQLKKAAARLARELPGSGRVVVDCVVRRVDRDNLDLSQGWERRLMSFTFRDGAVVSMEEPY